MYIQAVGGGGLDRTGVNDTVDALVNELSAPR